MTRTEFFCGALRRSGLLERPRWLRTLRRGMRLTILAYHRVVDIDPASYPLDSDLVSCCPAEFDRELEFVARHFDVVSFRDLAIQQRENGLVGATFGRSFYVLDDYSPLRDVTTNLLKNGSVLYLETFNFKICPLDPGKERLDICGVNGRATPDSQTGRCITVRPDIVSNLLFGQQLHHFLHLFSRAIQYQTHTGVGTVVVIFSEEFDPVMLRNKVFNDFQIATRAVNGRRNPTQLLYPLE